MRLRNRDGRPVLERMPEPAVAAILEETMHSLRHISDRAKRLKSYTLGIPGNKQVFTFGLGWRIPFRWQNLRVETQLPWFTSINAGTGFDNYLFRQRRFSNFPIWPVFQRA